MKSCGCRIFCRNKGNNFYRLKFNNQVCILYFHRRENKVSGFPGNKGNAELIKINSGRRKAYTLYFVISGAASFR